MSTQTKEVQNSRPPDWLFRGMVNPIMKFLLKSPFHSLLSDGLSILTFKGRKSGKTYSTPVAYHTKGEDIVYVFTRSNWWKNLRDGETATLRLVGKDYTVTAEIIEDKEQVWELFSYFVEQYDGNYRRVGVMQAKDAPEVEVRQAASDMLAVKFKLNS